MCNLAKITCGQDVLWILRNHGIVGAIRWLRRAAPYYAWLWLTPAGHKELEFDRYHRIETDGILRRWEMGDVGPNLCHAVHYLPSKPKKFHQLLQRLPIEYSEFTFVDIGCGKGRALFLAARYRFRRLIGVEFVKRLYDIACQNMNLTDIQCEIICMDATEYVFPGEPLVIYMCNPFDALPMGVVGENLLRSLRENPRSAYVVYWNPVEEHVWQKLGLRCLDRKPGEYAIYYYDLSWHVVGCASDG